MSSTGGTFAVGGNGSSQAGTFGSGGTHVGGAGGLGGATTAGAGGSTGGGGSAACNDIKNVGTDVKGKSAKGAFPPVGPPNEVIDGTYVLTSSVWYANLAPSETYRKRTLVISGQTMQTVTSEDFGPDVRVTFTLTPSDFLHQVPTCGKEEDWVSATNLAYNFTPFHTIDIREVNGGAKWPNRIDTYTLVP